MWLIIASLAAGVLLGAAGRIPRSWAGGINRLATVTLFAMLAALGAQVGANEDLTANLPRIGTAAAVITVAGTVGSVLFLWAVARITGIGSAGEREGG